MEDFDTNTVPFPIGSFPSDFIEYNGWLYFNAKDDSVNRELFRLNDTTPPQLVQDLIPGSLLGSFTAGNTYPIVFNGALYFNAQDSAHGYELRKYTGSGSIQLVADLNPGTAPSVPVFLTEFNGKLYFCASDGQTGNELWAFDGTNAPTQVMDIYPGFSGSEPQGMTVVGNRMYFAATDGIHGMELWSYDGINPPAMVYDLYPGLTNSLPLHLIEFNGKLLFSATNSQFGAELWSVQDTQPPVLVADIFPGSGGSFPYQPIHYNQKVFFSANDSLHGHEVWQYDGVNPPVRVTDLNPGTLTSLPSAYEVFNDTLYFRATGSGTGIEMFRIIDCFGADIVTQPDSVGVCKGDSASFSIAATGPGLTYQWFQNGTTIPGANTPLLTLGTVAPADSGDYYCVVTDTCGNADTSAVALLDYFEVSGVSLMPQDLYMCVGDTAIISVTASGTPASYQWMKDGIPLVNSGVYDGTGTADLELNGATLTENGDYAVEIVSGPCRVVSAIVPVEVDICDRREESDPAKLGRLYPNPGTGLYTLVVPGSDSMELEILVWDALGRKVTTNVTSLGNSKFQLSLTEQAKGMYFVEVVDRQKRVGVFRLHQH